MPQFTLDGFEFDETDNATEAEINESDDYTIAFRLQRCSDPTCSCESGKPRDLHGPYEVHIHRVDGRLKPEYVGVVDDEFKQTTIAVIERDGNICQRCGMKAQSGFHPVHHIERPETFDDPQEGHTEDNCVQLCKRCHGKTERLDAERQHSMFDGSVPVQQSLTSF